MYFAVGFAVGFVVLVTLQWVLWFLLPHEKLLPVNFSLCSGFCGSCYHMKSFYQLISQQQLKNESTDGLHA